MPCYGGPGEDQIIKQLTNERDYSDAVVCALLGELRKLNNYRHVIKAATENGKIDIQGWINNHAKKDIKRIKKTIIDKLSEHEKALLKDLLETDQQT